MLYNLWTKEKMGNLLDWFGSFCGLYQIESNVYSVVWGHRVIRKDIFITSVLDEVIVPVIWDYLVGNECHWTHWRKMSDKYTSENKFFRQLHQKETSTRMDLMRPHIIDRNNTTNIYSTRTLCSHGRFYSSVIREKMKLYLKI